MKTVGFLLVLATVSCKASALELTPNTRQINIANFYSLNQSGSLQRCVVIGFYEIPVPGVKTRLSLLPKITVKKVGGVSYIDRTGATITRLGDVKAGMIAKVRVSMHYDGALPSGADVLAVLSQVVASSDRYAVPNSKWINFSVPTGSILDEMTSSQKAQVKSAQDAQSTKIQAQEALMKRWGGDIIPSVVTINSVKIKLLVDNTIVAETSVPATLLTTDALPDLFVDNPTEFQLNRIKEQQFQIQMNYTFLDSKTGSINAHFDFSRMMRKIVTEEREIQSKFAQKGVAFLGFGKRKSTMSQFMKESASEQITQDERAGTTIEMIDADDSMINEYEARFFPQLTKENTIKAHLEAGKEAESAGKAQLANAHFGYAAAIQGEKVNLDTDTAGALASLSTNDYAGFIAKGLKIQSSQGSAATQYSRVLTQEIDQTTDVTWVVSKSISVQRSVTQIVVPDQATFKPYLGICGFATGPLFDFAFRPPKFSTGFVPVCIEARSPLDKANFVPGAVIFSVDDVRIESEQDLANVLQQYQPGNEVSIQTINQIPPMIGGKPRGPVIKVKLGRGLPDQE